MEKKNIWENVQSPLELHEDERGRIVDVFFKHNIEHVAVIDSKKGAKRGDHYHKKSIQHVLMTKGSMEYWHKPLGSDKPAKCVLLKVGDILTTPPDEIHALRFPEDAQFIVFSEGKRGGKDYESDTFRVSESIVSKSS
ncbi:MAG: hypothetical protein KJ600_00985 [Nanoarchaeota archaeon]|nr:hypothetical protein [Nanoarchaeota archaeon]MBU1103116.1 hypothetical protein [Nanoarchaeota archaeon]